MSLSLKTAAPSEDLGGDSFCYGGSPAHCQCAISHIEAVQGVASVKWVLDQMPLVPSTIFGRILYQKTCV